MTRFNLSKYGWGLGPILRTDFRDQLKGPNLRDRSVQGLENLKIFDRTEQGLEKIEILGLTEVRVYPNIDANLRILQSDLDDTRPRYGIGIV